MFLMRFGKKAGLSLAIYALSYVPYIGRLVLPAASFYTFSSVVGLGPAGIIFGTGIFLPKRYLVMFLQSYFASRSLMRELVRKQLSYSRIGHWYVAAGAIFLSHQIHKGTEEAMVSRPWRALIWLRCWILHFPSHSSAWSLDLRHCGSINCISHYKDHRSTSTSSWERGICSQPADMDQQARILERQPGRTWCTCSSSGEVQRYARSITRNIIRDPFRATTSLYRTEVTAIRAQLNDRLPGLEWPKIDWYDSAEVSLTAVDERHE